MGIDGILRKEFEVRTILALHRGVPRPDDRAMSSPSTAAAPCNSNSGSGETSSCVLAPVCNTQKIARNRPGASAGFRRKGGVLSSAIGPGDNILEERELPAAAAPTKSAPELLIEFTGREAIENSSCGHYRIARCGVRPDKLTVRN